MTRFVFCALAAASLATSAAAHATLEQTEAPAGSYYKAVLRVPHGCDGQATHTVKIRIPEGMIGVKPMPKAGWKLETVTGAYENSYVNHGRDVSEGVVEVIWSEGNLPSDWYDEFVLRGKLDDGLEEGSTLYFSASQTCADGSVSWIEIPAEGQDSHDLKRPAPALTITGGHHNHH